MPETDKRHLYRSRQERIIAGICGGLAEFFGISVSRVRIALLVFILFGGLALWVYLVLWLIIPQAPRQTIKP